MMGFLGAIHFWWPKITGRLYPENWGRTAAVLLFVGFIVTFLPQFVIGTLGMNRRYHAYAPEYQYGNIMSSAGSTIMLLGYALPFFYLLWSLKRGEIAGPNPWGATGLEWQTPSPPPTLNFDRTPVVTTGPYNYSAVEAERIGERADRMSEDLRLRITAEESERPVEEKEIA
jgi:cytochrome c oxidase subunit 1